MTAYEMLTMLILAPLHCRCERARLLESEKEQSRVGSRSLRDYKVFVMSNTS